MNNPKNQQHTPEPLQVMFSGNSSLCHIETGENNPIGQGVAICSMNKKHIKTAERMTDCYNALAGIDNPEEWVLSMKLMHEAALEMLPDEMALFPKEQKNE